MKLRQTLVIVAIAVVLTVISVWVGKLSYWWLPPQATAESLLVDDLFSFLVTIGSFIFLGVTGLVIYSVLFHRAGRYDISDGPAIEGNITLEIVWTVIPLLLVIWIASYSYQIYEEMAIKGPMELVHLHLPTNMEPAYAEPITSDGEIVEVNAKQWAWLFRYPNQNITSTELHLPVNRRAHLALYSEDVIHGFYIPAFRLKQDILPRRTIDFEFTPIRVGKYRLRDSQYSGTYFAAMQAYVVVDSEEDYQRWLSETATLKPSPAPNQAAQEYAFREKKSKPGWATVPPAEPPIVNYHS